jgi:hypothetical protein
LIALGLQTCLGAHTKASEPWIFILLLFFNLFDRFKKELQAFYLCLDDFALQCFVFLEIFDKFCQRGLC